MKKKKIIIIGIILTLLLLFPIRIKYKDGGTVAYKALIYSITKHHEKIPCNCDFPKYKTGITIQILNHTVYEKINNPI